MVNTFLSIYILLNLIFIHCIQHYILVSAWMLDWTQDYSCVRIDSQSW